MTTTAIKALQLAQQMLDALASSDIDNQGFEIDGQIHTADEIRSVIRRGPESLRQQPATYNDLTLHPRLIREIAEFPTAAAAAKAWGVTRQTLYAAANGNKPVPPSILRRIGLERVPRGLNQYREI